MEAAEVFFPGLFLKGTQVERSVWDWFVVGCCNYCSGLRWCLALSLVLKEGWWSWSHKVFYCFLSCLLFQLPWWWVSENGVFSMCLSSLLTMLLRDVFDIRGQGDLLQDIFANFDWNRRGSSESVKRHFWSNLAKNCT